MTEETREDPGGTVDATTVDGDIVAESTASGAMEPAGMVTWTSTIPDHERTARTTESQESGGTPGDQMEIGKTAGGTTKAMVEDIITASGCPRKQGQQREPGGRLNGD